MPLVPDPKNCDVSVKRAIQGLSKKLGYTASPPFVNVTLTDLTASNLVGTNASKLLESVTVSTGLDYTRPNLTLSHLGIEALTDPVTADKIFFWDNSADTSAWLGVGNSIAITTTTLDTIQDIRTNASPGFNQVTLGTDPTNVNHSVTKSYADALVAGAFWTDVDVGTIANVDLSNGLEAGDTIDDYTLVEGDRVLVKEQTDQTENGLYVVPASGAASRAADADTAAEIESKKCIPLNGTVTQHHLYFCITGDITLGVTDIKFAEVTLVGSHNTLTGIQGGTTNQYYHLTSAEHVELHAWLDDVVLSDGGAMNISGALTATNYTAANLLTACANNAGALDFSAASKTLTVEDSAVVSQDYTSDASPQFMGIELGHANDTTITRVSAGVIAVEGTNVMLVGDAPTAHTIVSHSDTTATGANLNTLVGGGDVGALHTHAAAYQPKDAELTSLAALSYVAASFVKMTGANTFALRTIGETADDLEATIDHDNLANGGAHDYSYISGNDGATGVTAAELEELSDGSETTLHTHDYGAAFGRPIILTPQCSCGPAANFATHDTIAGGSTPAEVVSVLDFDADASEYSDFKFALPSGYAGGGLDITIYFSMTSDHDEGTPHKVRWEVGFARIDDDGIAISGDHAYDYNGVSATVPSVVSEISVDHILFTNGADMDSLAASEMAILRIYRDHDHADDNATGDAELQMITIKEN